MIVVKVELWPGGCKSAAKEIGRMTITNDGQNRAHPLRGDYDIKLMRRGTRDTVNRRSQIKNHPRKSRSVWNLVRKALDSVKT